MYQEELPATVTLSRYLFMWQPLTLTDKAYKLFQNDPIPGAAIRNSTKFFTFTGANLLLMLLLAAHAALTVREQSAADTGNAALARRLGLTDLCLFTEARYTRHPSMADIHSPFQDAPSSFDYFPSGSLIMPAKRMKERQ